MQPDRRSPARFTARLVNGKSTLKLVAVQFLVVALLVVALAVAEHSSAFADTGSDTIPTATYDHVETADSDVCWGGWVCASHRWMIDGS